MDRDEADLNKLASSTAASSRPEVSSELAARRQPWWKGSKGEWFVVAQLALMGLVFFGPRTVGGQPDWPFPFVRASHAAGTTLIVLGGVLFLAGLLHLGRRLTPLPYPKAGTSLVQTGPFAVVRHPIYSGGLVLAFGWALFVQGWLTLVAAVALFGLLDAKSRREERWLVERFPDYSAYQHRVRRLIPFIY